MSKVTFAVLAIMIALFASGVGVSAGYGNKTSEVWQLPTEIDSVWQLPGEVYTPSTNTKINSDTKAPDYSHLYYVLD